MVAHRVTLGSLSSRAEARAGLQAKLLSKSLRKPDGLRAKLDRTDVTNSVRDGPRLPLPFPGAFAYVRPEWGGCGCPTCIFTRRQPEGPAMVAGQRSANIRESGMPLYEHVFLARQDLAQAQVDAIAENATKIIEDNGGKVVKTETWGLKSLSYKIAKNRKAHYVMLDVDAPPAALAELERQTNINEDVIRFMTIRVDEHEAGPSAMMRRERSGRSDRGSDRGDRGHGGGGGRSRDEDGE
jgi:small subunit ribosomal protein S6